MVVVFCFQCIVFDHYSIKPLTNSKQQIILESFNHFLNNRKRAYALTNKIQNKQIDEYQTNQHIRGVFCIVVSFRLPLNVQCLIIERTVYECSPLREHLRIHETFIVDQNKSYFLHNYLKFL